MSNGHLNSKTAWEFACEWYTPDQIRYSIKNRYRDTTESMKIPGDIDSPEFAEWLTDQYRLAMAKGIDIAQQDSREEIERLRAALAWAAGNLMLGDNKRFAELFPAFSDLVELPQTGDSNA